MIQKVFLDTNILIDLMLNRMPFAGYAEKIFKLRDEYDYEIYISALSVANIVYVLNHTNKSPHAVVGKLMQLTEIVNFTKDIFNQTLQSKFNDFEDGIQHSSAIFVDADVIVTRNKKDFKYAILPVLSPEEFLDNYKI